MLVWGVGHDSSLWAELNKGGRTTFLENHAGWASTVQATHRPASRRLSPHLLSFLFSALSSSLCRLPSSTTCPCLPSPTH